MVEPSNGCSDLLRGAFVLLGALLLVGLAIIAAAQPVIAQAIH